MANYVEHLDTRLGQLYRWGETASRSPTGQALMETLLRRSVCAEANGRVVLSIPYGLVLVGAILAPRLTIGLVALALLQGWSIRPRVAPPSDSQPEYLTAVEGTADAPKSGATPSGSSTCSPAATPVMTHGS